MTTPYLSLTELTKSAENYFVRQDEQYFIDLRGPTIGSLKSSRIHAGGLDDSNQATFKRSVSYPCNPCVSHCETRVKKLLLNFVCVSLRGLAATKPKGEGG